jgi:hypothetical protein
MTQLSLYQTFKELSTLLEPRLKKRLKPVWKNWQKVKPVDSE